MTETPDHPTAPTSVASAPPPPESPSRLRTHDGRPSRLALVALWVAIVAGVVFTVAVIFFSGFALGRHSGGGGFHHKHSGGHEHGMMFHREGPPMGPMGPMGPGPWQQGPGFGPGGPGGPSGPAPTTAPTTPSPPTSPRP
jgi:hypothetical protein